MASREVTVRVSAQDNFSSVMDRYNRQMGAAEQATRRADQANQQASQGFGRLGTAIGGAIAAIGIQQVISFAEDFNELGNQVNITTQTFEQLIGEFGDADTIMLRLQDVTGGIVDNMTLMSGASRLASMGLATNSAEVERLTELAVRLGGAMGNDAAASIENFSLLLANESVLRLDSFGISSARVRTRIDELLASGEALNRSEAFRLAVLEEGGRSLERLGDAASAAETPLARLQTTLENIAQQGASNFTTGVNAIIGGIEGIGTGLEQYQESRTRAMTALMGSNVQPAGTTIFGDTFFTDEQVREMEAWLSVVDQANAEANAAAAEIAASFDKGIDGVKGTSDALISLVDLQAQFAPLAEAGAAAWEQTQAAIEQAATAFSNISLGTLLGEGQGNLALGGIGDMVVAELNARGNIDATALQAAADAYNLAAGRIGEETIIMRDTIIPILAAITETQGGEEGAQRAGQVEGFLRNTAAAGITPDNNVFYGLFAEAATGTLGGIDFQGLILEPFAEAFEGIRTEFGADSELGAAAADTFAGLPVGIDEAREGASELQGTLDAMTTRNYTIQVHIDETELNAFIAKINGTPGVGGTTMGTIVRDNGGQVPGVDTRGHAITEF